MNPQNIILPNTFIQIREPPTQQIHVIPPHLMSCNAARMPPEPIPMPPSYAESQRQITNAKVIHVTPFPMPPQMNFPMPLPLNFPLPPPVDFQISSEYFELQKKMAVMNVERQRYEQDLSSLKESLNLHKELLERKDEHIDNLKEKLRSKNGILSTIVSTQQKKDFLIKRQRDQLYTLMNELSLKDQIIAVKKNNIEYIIDREPFTLHSGPTHLPHVAKASVGTMTTGASRENFKKRTAKESRNIDQIVDDMFQVNNDRNETMREINAGLDGLIIDDDFEGLDDTDIDDILISHSTWKLQTEQYAR